MTDSIQKTLEEFVQSLDFDEADDLLLDEISGYNENVKFEKVLSELPNGGKIVEFEDSKLKKPFFAGGVDEGFDDSAAWNEKDDDDHYQQEKSYFDSMIGKMIDISGDGGVFKKVIRVGSGLVCPANALCRIHYSAFLRDEIDPFDSTISRGKHCLIKVGSDENGLPGLLVGLKSMQKGETAQFLVTPNYAYGSFGCSPRIPPHSHILFEVEMLGFIDRTSLIEYTKTIEKNDESSDQSSMSIRDIVHVANTLILEGNDHFKNRNPKPAIRCYGKALRLTETCSLADNDDENTMNELCKRIFLNVSLCCIKLKKYNHATDMCHKVLNMESDNLKAHFRLGQVYKASADFEKAKTHLNKCLEISPNNLGICNEMKALDVLMGACNKHLKDFSKKMFGVTNSDSAKVELEHFAKTSMFRQDLYEHFFQKLQKFKNAPQGNQLNLPNNFNEIEMKHLLLAGNRLEITSAIDKSKNIIILSK